MVTIEERRHELLAGINSIFITFSKVDKKLIDIVKRCSSYNYNKKTHEWELLITSLSFLVEEFKYLDDIKLILLDEKEELNTVTSENLLNNTRTTLFDHQKEAVMYGLNHDKWMLLDAPGLGKTLSMISLAEERYARKEIEHCLIICGINSLKTNWENEISIHSKYDSVIIGKKITSTGRVIYSSMLERAEQIKNKIKEFFVIINIESLRSDEVIEAFKKSENKFDMMVLDEAHKCKGTKAVQSNNLLKLSSKYMIAMTGTLLMNNPLDSYIPLSWIGKEKKDNVTRFKSSYCMFSTEIRGKIIGFKNLDILKDEISSCSLRRTKDLLNLPEKNIINEVLEMEPSHEEFYNNVKDGIKSECDKINLSSSNLLALTTRLRQATSCPNMLTTKNIYSSKLERCIELVEELISNNEKVVIFSMFKEPIYELSRKLKQYEPLIGTGDMLDDDVFANVKTFQTDVNHKVFLGTVQKMGTGFTLTEASYMIFIDMPWTEALQEQAEDRIHRIGSKKPVFIYRLICKDTIDELVLKIVNRKGAISSYVVDDVLDDSTIELLRKFILDL